MYELKYWIMRFVLWNAVQAPALIVDCDTIKKEFDLRALASDPVVYEAVGCKQCRNTGYSGRQAICEFLILNEKTRDMVTARATSREIKQQAVKDGMKTLRQHGWEKVASGLTSPSEVLRVTEDE